jgi:hypothetical protein
MIRGAKISRDVIDSNFDILLNVLQFQAKIKIKSVEESKAHVKSDTSILAPKSEVRPNTNPGIARYAKFA